MDRHLALFYPTRSFFDVRPWHLLSALDHEARDMNCQFSRLERQLHNALMNQQDGSNGNNNSIEASLGLHPQVVSEGDKKKYLLNIHMGNDFAPENLKVSLKDHVVTIDAKTEQKSEDGNSRFYQEVTRKFTLPSNIDMKEVKSALTPDGVLRIEAPLPQQALPEPPKPTSIPIKLD